MSDRFRGSPEKLRDVAGTWRRGAKPVTRFLEDAQACAHSDMPATTLLSALRNRGVQDVCIVAGGRFRAPQHHAMDRLHPRRLIRQEDDLKPVRSVELNFLFRISPIAFVEAQPSESHPMGSQTFTEGPPFRYADRA
ncbi:hypothetical protein A6P39_002070 [Streptomyces sp. FXJ1.172]|uniref:hypothetical protein n=1 Tax=Streptomyces sp. FXJ1.172 TaxID=710705 RepID=UPI0007D02C67|nr:hypothetical protein [Streptomyces sp. FXJ1.172]WEO92971.1 hypothetical protein A6P39_002070 [Streptomyces sp. FXJ1.172]